MKGLSIGSGPPVLIAMEPGKHVRMKLAATCYAVSRLFGMTSFRRCVPCQKLESLDFMPRGKASGNLLTLRGALFVMSCR